MTSQKIGNWLITDEGIEWKGVEKIDYFIRKESLLEIGYAEREGMYNWLVHLSDKTWVKIEDIITLNAAFICAVERFNLKINLKVLIDTIEDQLETMKIKPEQN